MRFGFWRGSPSDPKKSRLYTNGESFCGGQILTDKELKKLNRYQLLELIIMQSEELEQVKAQLAEARRQLEQRNIQIEQAGSIAQAALQLSGIFEAAQSAADIYLQNVKQQYGRTQQEEQSVQLSENIITADAVDKLIMECAEESAESTTAE